MVFNRLYKISPLIEGIFGTKSIKYYVSIMQLLNFVKKLSLI